MNKLIVLNELDRCDLECDGLSTVISSLLTAAGFKHELYIGRVSSNVGRISPHLWIEIDGFVIDYRLRMWLGDDPSIPHGVFKKDDHTNIIYTGTLREARGGEDPIAQILCFTTGIGFKDMVQKLKSDVRN